MRTITTLLAVLALTLAACSSADDSVEADGAATEGVADNPADSDASGSDSSDPSAPTTATTALAASTTTTDTDESDEPGEPTEDETLFPDVLEATARSSAAGTWDVSATLSSPYDSPARYADAWRVVGPDGTVYGVRELTHDHAAEQPFTRSLSGVEIPDDIDQVTIEGRDQVSGWGGQTVTISLER